MFRSSENKKSSLRQDDCFQNKKKEEIGHYGQTLFRMMLTKQLFIK